MIYNLDNYNLLKKGMPLDGDESFSKLMKVDCENNRMTMFTEFIDFLEKNNIPYTQVDNSFDIEVKDFILCPNMKATFRGSNKSYQYNLEGIINRLNKF